MLVLGPDGALTASQLTGQQQAVRRSRLINAGRMTSGAVAVAGRLRDAGVMRSDRIRYPERDLNQSRRSSSSP